MTISDVVTVQGLVNGRHAFRAQVDTDIGELVSAINLTGQTSDLNRAHLNAWV